MSGRPLPVLTFAPFRRYPTKLAEQEFEDDLLVCGSCLSGVCCSSEDPIYLTSFDVFRLSAFFNLTPAEFLLTFTQERFDGEDSELERRPWIDDPGSSKVTYLRRRGNTPTSPCIFLKYVREEDGTPRRICSVHDARPLSCREFYFSHCKTRHTGELAALLAEGYEKVRDGEITGEMADAQLARFGGHDFSSAGAAESMEYAFWFEMKRVLNMERANVEGSASYDAAGYQDPIDEKLNRVLSAKYLRFEEDYGPEPCNEQLMPYTSGLSFAGSPERARIMGLVRTPPSGDLYAPHDYPISFGLRTMVPGVRHAEVFPLIPEAEIRAHIDGLPADPLFPSHDLPEVRAITRQDVRAAALKGVNHLIRFSGHIAAMGNVLECEPPGVLELELLAVISALAKSPEEYFSRNPYLEPVKLYMAAPAVGLLEDRAASAKRAAGFFALYKELCSVEAAVATLPPDLRDRFDAVRDAALGKLRKDRLDDYVSLHNPVAARRAAGKRLTARGAWSAWERSALDAGYAARAGFEGLDLRAYYQAAVAELEAIPIRKSYAMRLGRVVVSLGRGMTLDGHALYAGGHYEGAAKRLASYGSKLLAWMEREWRYEHAEVEAMAVLASSMLKLAGPEQSSRVGFIARRLLDSRLCDGSWGADSRPPGAGLRQEDYLRGLYRVAGACVDGLLHIGRSVAGARASMSDE